MKTCRLKIISSNIINDIDHPKIHYVSQNKKVIIKPNVDNKQIDFLEDKITQPMEDEKTDTTKDYITKDNNAINKIQLEELIKNDFLNSNEQINDNNNNIYINEIENGKENNIDININENENKEENNIDINDLCTVSNQHFYEEFKMNDINMNINNLNNNDNFNTISNNNEMNNSSSYPYKIEYKKRETKTYLRNLFKTRDKKPYMNRSLSMKRNKKSLIKNIITKNSTNIKPNQNKKNTANSLKKNNTLNKHGSILKININKSFCLNKNNNSNYNYNLKNNNSNKNIKLKSRNRNLNNHKKSYSKNSNNSKNSSSSKKKESALINKIKTLKIKKINLEEDSQSSFISWNIIEKNDFFPEQKIDYKQLINDLLLKECQLVQEKENIINIYEQKLKPLRELNDKLLEENNEELDRQDELKGELTILKNQYEKLFAIVNSDKLNDNYLDSFDELEIIENNKFQEEFNNKIKEIELENINLNENLKNGEILIIIKPLQKEKITKNDSDEITLMLKGIFTSRHIFDSDIVVDLIWKYDKKLQTIYFLVEEFMNVFALEATYTRDILMNYFYSFCKKYNYMNINMFKKEFKEQIGEIQIYNKNIYFHQILNFHGSKIKQLIDVLKDKDVFNLGIIKYEMFSKSLYEIGLDLSDLENYENILEFLVFCMKKDLSLELKRNNKEKSKSEIKYSLFDLFYGNLNELIDEYHIDLIKDPFKKIRNFMNKNDLNNVEYVLRPILNKKYILKINDKEYIDIFILNKYLRRIGIINKEEKIWVDVFEEELVDKDKFIDDIYNYNYNDNIKKENSNEKIKQEVDDFIKDIFGNIK